MRAVQAAAMMSLVGAPIAPLAARSAPATVPVEEVSAVDQAERLADGTVTSAQLVRAYLDRIARMDRKGPKLHAIIALNPDALAQARQRDAERKAGHVRGPLHGLPILVKDNVETLDPMPTTAGSLALKDNRTGRDAPMIARLRAAGAIILGKTNLSEWANFRSNRSISGWSGIGGLTRNPYVLSRTACGSSSGTGAAIAASFAAVGIGTETDGSVTCPSAMNGLVGLKPTLGMVSRTHIVPISHSQDTAGPMGRSVRDVALLFAFMAGSDPADPATVNADSHVTDFVAGLSTDALRGVRLGIMRPANMTPEIVARYDAALAVLAAAGATLVDVDSPALEGLDAAEETVLKYEFKADLNAYLATTPASVTTRTLSDLIAFNTANAARELGLFGQESFEEADALGGLDSPAYRMARAMELALTRTAGIDAMLTSYDVAALVSPSYGPPGPIDPARMARFIGFGAAGLPAISGYPHLTVPMGLTQGLPLGISFVGPAWSDAALLRYGYAFEQAASMREAPQFLPDIPTGTLLDPLEP